MATILFDQSGLPAGTVDRSRSDIVINVEVDITAGALVGNAVFGLLDRPIGSAAAIGGTGLVQQLTPDVSGTYRVRVDDDADPTGNSAVVHTFTVRTALGIALPAFNERASNDANDVDTNPGTWVAESETNEGGSFKGWHPATDEAFRLIEAAILARLSLAGGTMLGTLDMGGNPITNASTVNGVALDATGSVANVLNQTGTYLPLNQTSVLWIDLNTPAALADQDGSAFAPFATVQQFFDAVPAATADGESFQVVTGMIASGQYLEGATTLVEGNLNWDVHGRRIQLIGYGGPVSIGAFDATTWQPSTTIMRTNIVVSGDGNNVGTDNIRSYVGMGMLAESSNHRGAVSNSFTAFRVSGKISATLTTTGSGNVEWNVHDFEVFGTTGGSSGIAFEAPSDPIMTLTFNRVRFRGSFDTGTNGSAPRCNDVQFSALATVKDMLLWRRCEIDAGLFLHQNQSTNWTTTRGMLQCSFVGLFDGDDATPELLLDQDTFNSFTETGATLGTGAVLTIRDAMRVQNDGTPLGSLGHTFNFTGDGVTASVVDGINIINVPALAGGPFLPLAGGTMAGDIAMGGNNVSGAGTVNGVPLTAAGTGALILGDNGVYKVDLGRFVGATGWLSGGITTQASATEIDVTLGTGRITDFSNPANPVTTEVPWVAQLGVAITAIATTDVTLIAFDIAGTLVQLLESTITRADFRTHIIVGEVGHSAGNIIGLGSTVRNAAYDGQATVGDFLEVIGPVTRFGVEIVANATGNLTADHDAGEIFSQNSNIRDDPTVQDLSPVIAASPYVMRRTFRDNLSNSVKVQNITPDADHDPTMWDDGSGTLAAVPANDWTNQRIFVSSGGTVLTGFGQAVYNTKAEALTALQTETFVEQSPQPCFALRAFLTVKGNASDLTDPADAEFTRAPKFRLFGVSGGGVQAAGSFVGLTDTPNVYTGAALQGLRVNAGETGIEFTDALTFAAGRTLYVDQNQTITTPTGSVGAPFATIGAAITAAIALTPTAANPVEILTASGNYTEAITLVTGLTVRSMGGSALCRITAPVATGTIVTGAAGSSLLGFMLFGANGAGGIAYTVAGNADVRACKVQDCETGYECTSGILAVFDSTAQRVSGQVLTTGYRALTGGQVHAFVSRAIGVSAQIATGFVADGAGSEIHVHAGAAVNCAVGVQATNSGRVQLHAIRFENCDVNRLVGPGTLGIMRGAGSVGQANVLDLQVTGTAATVEFVSDQATAERVQFLSDTSIAGLISEPETDSESAGSRFYANTSVGAPSKIARVDAGEGGASAQEIVVFQFDDSAVSGSKFTDVTAAARSRTGSTFGFPTTTQVADALLFGAPRTHGGVTAALTQAMSADGFLTWEFWDGAAWVELPPGGTRGSGIMAHGPVSAGAVSLANVAFETTGGQHIHYNEEISATWVGDTGTLDEVPVTAASTFWVRVRMSTLPATQPVFEQIKVLYAATSMGSTGVLFHGGARGRTRIPIYTNTFETGFGNVPTNQDLSYAPNVDIGLVRNQFVNGAIDQVGLIIPIPNVFDTSSPIAVELEWQPSTTDTGDVNWELFYARGTTDSFAGNSAGAGTLDEFSDTALQAASGTIGDGQLATFSMRLPNANPGDGDSIALMFRRDATGVGPSDTFVGNAIVRKISMNGLIWRSGKA